MDKNTIVKLFESDNKDDNILAFELMVNNYSHRVSKLRILFKRRLYFIGNMEDLYIYCKLNDKGDVTPKSPCIIFEKRQYYNRYK